MKVLEITRPLSEDNLLGVARGVAPTLIGQAAKSPGVEGMLKHLTNYGPGMASAAYDVAKGNWTGALINAFTTVAPNSNVKLLAQAGDVVNTLSLLKSIASNPATLGLFLATYSPGLNSGEHAEIARIHAQQDAQRLQPTAVKKPT